MAQVSKGQKVSIHFTGKLKSGDTFDTSRDGEAVEVVAGGEQSRFPHSVVEGLIGMKSGDKKTINVAAKEAFGAVKDELILEVPKANMDENFFPVEGQYYHINQGDVTILVKVVGIGEDTITLDANHPLAGKDLVYEIEII